MSSYQFPLGNDTPDRDLARLRADLAGLPTAAVDGAPTLSLRGRISLRRARIAAALRHHARVQGRLHDRIAAPVTTNGCRPV